METINNIIEKTKETIGLAEPHEAAKVNDEQDLDSGHTVLETVKDTILSVVEKTKEILPFVSSGDQQHQDEDSQSKDIQQKAIEIKENVQQKASDVKENVQQKASDVKENIQQKTSDVKENIQQKSSEMKESAQQKTSDMKQAIHEKVDNKHVEHPEHHQQHDGERITQKMKNWNESLHKLEEQHHQPLTKAHESHESKHEQFDFEKSYGDDAESTESSSSSSTTTATSTEGIQQKLIDIKDATTEKLTQAKDVVLQKGAELKETISNKLQGEEVKKDVSEGDNQTSEQSSGLVAAVSGAIHNAIDAGKGLMETAAAKMEQLTENTLGDVSVVDASEKNKQQMAQPGQPKEMGTDVQPVSKSNESAA